MNGSSFTMIRDQQAEQVSMIIQQFLHWVRDAQTTDREEATYALVRAYLHGDLAEENPSLVDAAMTVLLDDESPLVRRALSLALADSNKAPRHVILGLAADQPDVAGPILRQSPKFMDGELVDIVVGREEKVQQAVAEREQVSSVLAYAIAEHGGLQACLSLLYNKNAAITRECMMLIAQRHGFDTDIRKALHSHAGVDVQIKHTLIAELAEALRELTQNRNWMPEERCARVTQDSLEQATVELLAECPDEDLPRFVAFLGERRHLTSALMLRAITSGRISFFVTALSLLADIPEERVYGLLEDGRESNFQAIYERAGLPQAAYRAFYIAFDVYKRIAGNGFGKDLIAFRQRLLDEIIEQYSRETTLIGDKIIIFLHRLAAEASRDLARVNAETALQQLADEEGWILDTTIDDRVRGELSDHVVDTHLFDEAFDNVLDETLHDHALEAWDDAHADFADMQGYGDYEEEESAAAQPDDLSRDLDKSGFGKRRQDPMQSAA